MNKTRTQYAKLNSSFSVAKNIVKILTTFLIKTIFLYYLNITYLGATSLFSEILSFLSVAELGIGTAIIFSMYKYIRENNLSKIQALYKLYKKCYIIIGSTMLIIGLGILPLLKVIIKGYEDYPDINLELIYFVYLIITVLPYLFFSYRSCILTAYQQSYISNLIFIIYEIPKTLVLFLILKFTRNFYLYLVLFAILSTLTEVTTALISYIKHKDIFGKNDSTLDIRTKKEIFKCIGALVIFQLGGKLYAATDNFIISNLLGLNEVGIYSNYSMIIRAVSDICQGIFYALIPSIGSIGENEYNKKEEIMDKINYLAFIIYGFTSICLFVLLNPFIVVWLNNDNYLFDMKIVFICVMNYLVVGLTFAPCMFREAYGLHVYGKFRPLIQGVINIILSYILGFYYGLFGIFLATFISFAITMMWVEPKIAYKYALNKSPKKFYINYFFEIIIIIIIGTLTYFLVDLISFNGALGLTLKFIVCIMFSSIALFISSIYNKNYKFYLNMGFNIFRKTFLRRKK